MGFPKRQANFVLFLVSMFRWNPCYSYRLMFIALESFTVTLGNRRNMFQENLQDSQFEHILGLVSRNPFIFVGGVPGVCSNLLSGAAGSGGWYKSTSCSSWTSGRAVGVGRPGRWFESLCFNFHPDFYGEIIHFDVHIFISKGLVKTRQLRRFQFTPPHFFTLHKNLGCQIFGWVGWVDFLGKAEVLVRSYRGCERWIQRMSVGHCRTNDLRSGGIWWIPWSWVNLKNMRIIQNVRLEGLT